MATVFTALRQGLKITKKQLTEMGINPDKEPGSLTVEELGRVATALDMTGGDILDNYFY